MHSPVRFAAGLTLAALLTGGSAQAAPRVVASSPSIPSPAAVMQGAGEPESSGGVPFVLTPVDLIFVVKQQEYLARTLLS